MRKIFKILIMIIVLCPLFVNAQSNYNTTFNITLNEFEYMDYGYGSSDNTYKDFIDELKNYNTSNYFYITFSNSGTNYTSRPDNIKIIITDTIPDLSNTIIYYKNQRYNGTLYIPKFNSSNTYKYKQINYANFDYNNDLTEIKNCLDNFNNCSWSSLVGGLDSNFSDNVLNNINDTDYSFNITPNIKDYPIYSNFNITMGTPTQAQIDESTIIIKNVKINDSEITNKFLTYYDLYYSSPEPEPDPEPEPTPSSTTKTSWIYWFSEPEDIEGYLNNIYTLLFLYCVFQLIIKVVNSFKKAGGKRT